MTYKPGKGMTGKHQSLSARLAIGRALTGREHSEKTKQKISETRLGRYCGESNPHWKGGMTFSKEGYPMLYMPGHPHATQNGYVLEARLVAEEALGRCLKSDEIVHHFDEDPFNNCNSNLLVCKQDYHMWLHGKMRREGVGSRASA